MALERFVCLDPVQLSGEQLGASAKLLDQFSNVSLKPLNEIDEDENRARLDRAFLIDVLGLPASLADKGGALELLRAKLASEPSIHGRKKGKSSTD